MKKTELFGSELQLRRLHPGENISEVVRVHTHTAVKRIALVLGIGALMCIILCVIDAPRLIEERYLSRSVSGEGTTEYSLHVVPDSYLEEIGERDVQVTVSEQKLSGTALDELYERAYGYIERAVLGDNPDAEHISSDLCFVTEVPGTVMAVNWEFPDLNYVFSDGRIRTEHITEPVIIVLAAEIYYFDEVRSRQFAVRLVPIVETASEVFEKELDKALSASDLTDPEAEFMELPTEINGIAVNWSEQGDETVIGLILLTLITAIVIIPATRSELTGKLKKRETELARDYPDIISKLVMLSSAGMTTRSVWQRIAEEYRETREKTGKRYAYEEMLVSEQELQMGKPEAAVYEDYGIRCGTVAYQKLGSLLSRNLRRGSREMNRLLMQEAEEAFAERRAEVKVRTEELGTKLLIPMTIMMCIIFAVIIVPAFQTFTI